MQVMLPRLVTRCFALGILACAGFMPLIASAQIGHVVSVQGTALVERAGKAARIIGAGEALEQKDVINVAQASHAVLEFRDKSRITLRPNTIFRVETYSDTAPQAMVLGLTKGGFRAVTGDIGKQNPSAVRFQTDSVVLGIRGTEFDARLCEDDCTSEEGGKPAVRAVARAAARLIEVNGTANAVDGKGGDRGLVAGAALYEGETLSTGPGSNALVAFRDGSRVSLTPQSALAIARFDFDEASPGKGAAHMKLLAGSAHVWTGQLARIGPDAFLFETSAGMIRTAGAGFSAGARRDVERPRLPPAALLKLEYAHAKLWTQGFANVGAQPPALEKAGGIVRTGAADQRVAASSGGDVITIPGPDDVFVVHTWDGSVIIQTATERIELPKTATLAIAVIDGKISFLSKPPAFLTQTGQSLDLVNVDPSTFGKQTATLEPGLYVWVRDGAVTLGQGGQVVELKAGNAARITNRIALLDSIPNFMRFDFTPRPGGIIPQQVPRFFRAPDGSVSRVCK